MDFGKGIFPGLILLSLFSTLTCSGGAVSDPAATGPYAAGKTVYNWHDETRDRELPTSVWYPARPDGSPERDQAPYPLILFSHGSGGSRELYTFITEHLATHGFVVAACDHEGNVGMEQFVPAEPYMAIKRPQDISFILDRLLESEQGGDQFLSGLFDPEKVGAAGHSYGGYTTLALSGAVIQIEDWREMCNSTEANPRCAFIDLPDEIPDLSDPRIKVGVTLAAGLNEIWGTYAQGVSTVSVPMMMIGGTTDILVPKESLELVYAALPPHPKFFIQIIGGGHTGFTDSGNLDGTLNSDRSWEIVRNYAAAFFQAYLAGEKGYRKYLSSDYAAYFAGSPADFNFFRAPE